MTISNLLGYARKSVNGNALKLSISAEAFKDAEKYTTRDGKSYVSMILSITKIQALLDDQKEVTGIVQLVN